jgi:DNA mismatch repair protein MutL
MSSIHVLPDLLVNKIAAGEVIERPASVVKELVENSLDAGATHIAVRLDDGGRSLIRVVDDGCGMSPDDLRLCVLPHATSKIGSDDDLASIRTMGFRGEALASIGAVSRLTITSRTREAIEGAQVIVSGEKFEHAGAAGCPVGTSIEVRDLFFNIPARRRFLRSASTESGHITEQFARLALGHRHVGFELNSANRTVHALPAPATVPDRVARFYGPELGAELLAIGRQERGVTIEGYAAPPARSRSSGNWQYIFLNGRYIRDRVIQHAIREAYHGLMEPSRFPVVFLFISIDPACVDVNVHPTKIEVRWQDSNLIYSQVLSVLREKFQRTDLTPAWRVRPPEDEPFAGEEGAGGAGASGARLPLPSPEEQARIREAAADYFKGLAPVAASPARTPAPDEIERSRWEDRPVGTGGVGARSAGTARTAGSPAFGATLGADSWRSLYQPAEPQAPAAESRRATSSASIPAGSGRALRPAIQLHNTYLVAESDDGIVIIDQHALHERVLYDELTRRIASGALESQRLLLPETVTITPQQLALLENHGELLQRLGIDWSPFGPDCVAVQSFPAILKDTDVVSFLRDLLDKLSERAHAPGTEVVIHELLDMMACKAAVKAGDPLTADEIDALIARKELVEKSSNCPHGRPTMLRLTVRDLEKQFKRT